MEDKTRFEFMDADIWLEGNEISNWKEIMSQIIYEKVGGSGE